MTPLRTNDPRGHIVQGDHRFVEPADRTNPPTIPTMRVVSLLPSATELLCAAGAGHLLVGRSHECDFPAEITDRPVLTAQRTLAATPSEIDKEVRDHLERDQSLYDLDEGLLADLEPDIVLTQDLCEVCSVDLAQVRRACAGLPTRPEIVSTNPETVEDVLDDLMRIGRACGVEAHAHEALMALRARFFRAADYVTPFADGPVVAFLEWTDPIFVGGHWTPQLIERAGGRHPLNETVPLEGAGAGAGHQGGFRKAGKSIAVPPEAVAAIRPDFVIISPCGFDLERTRAEARSLAEQDWFRDLPALKSGRVALVDGNQMFNRPGPRLVDAYEWLVGWLNNRPELIPDGFPWETLGS